jgi:peptide/nickel transport system substrate-binding protein
MRIDEGRSPEGPLITVSRARGIAIAAVLVAAACTGGDRDDTASAGSGDAQPRRGGRLEYALEAETTGGWCLPEAQLAVSGIEVARSIYDTLTAPNADGDYVPYLAESVEPNDDFTRWTITIREGVTFHDGSDLTAEVVKNNLEAYRGRYPGRRSPLFSLVFADVAAVEVAGDRTVEVTTRRPWVAFPAYLFSNGRTGIMAQAQLDDAETCHRRLIGTGPFELRDWVPNDHLSLVRNERYWRTDGDGIQLPYLDELEFRPVPEPAQRLNSLVTGDTSITHEADGRWASEMRAEAQDGTIELIQSVEFTSVVYLLLNTAQPPFDDPNAREAVASAIDRSRLIQLRSDDVSVPATGPFAPGSEGYLADSGFPDFDPDRASDLAARYAREHGRELTFTISSTADSATLETMQIIRAMLADVGIETSLRQTDQTTIISDAIAGQYQMHFFRGHQGGDPDEQYIWWHTGLPTNFGRIDDTTLDGLLDEGRTNPDTADRRRIYEEVNRRLAEGVWNVWLWWPAWTVATLPEVHGIYGPALPDGSDPFPGLAAGHPTVGIWID